MQASASIVENIEYRVVLLRSGSGKLLLLSSGVREKHLPRVAIPANVRMAQEFQKTLHSAWGLHGIILDVLSGAERAYQYLVVEIFDDLLPSGLLPASFSDLSTGELSESDRRTVTNILTGQSMSPFARLGWIEDAIGWVEQETRAKIRSKLAVRQYTAGGAFTLLCLPAEDGCSYWLKATGAPNAHESAITTILSRVCHGYVAEVVAVKPSWNAWIMRGREDNNRRAPLSSLTGRRGTMQSAVASLASLQVCTIGYENELLTAGAFDQRPSILQRNSNRLFERIRQVMALQTSVRVKRVEDDRLYELESIFSTVCNCVDELPIPMTILQGDMDDGNIVHTDRRSIFVDWCEAYIGCPFVTLEHLLLLNVGEDAHAKSEADQVLITQYCSILGTRCSMDAMRVAVKCMPLLGAASAIYGRGTWLDAPSETDSQRYAYVRAITRYMDRAANAPDLLDALAPYAPSHKTTSKEGALRC